MPKGVNLAPQGIGKAAHTVLGGGIDGVHRCSDQTGHRGHVDDVPGAAGQHGWQDGARDLDHPAQVDVNLHVNVSGRIEHFKPVQAAHPGVVYQDVDLAICCQARS